MKKVAEWFLFGTVALLFWGLGAGGEHLFDLLLLVTLGGLGILCCLLFGQDVFSRLMRMRKGLVLLGGYLALDFIGFCLAGDWGILWAKYRVTMMLLAVFLAILLLDAPRAVLLGAGCAAVALAATTLLRYFAREDAPLYYLLRLSLRQDYNMYASALLIGWIALFFLLGRGGMQAELIALGATVFIFPVLMQSGSRRALMALPMASVVAVGWYLVQKRHRWLWRLGGVLCCSVLIFVAVNQIEQGLLTLGGSPVAEQRVESGAPSLETAAAERYETIAQGSLLQKRRVIWGLAIEEIKTFSPMEHWLGRGGGENIRLYDRIGAPLDAIYPDREARYGALSAHNLLLADWLDGGLLKVVGALLLLGTLPLGLWRLWSKDRGLALALGLILGFTIASNLVSNRFGLLYDRVFLLFYPLLLMGRDVDEPPHCNADDVAST